MYLWLGHCSRLDYYIWENENKNNVFSIESDFFYFALMLANIIWHNLKALALNILHIQR